MKKLFLSIFLIGIISSLLARDIIVSPLSKLSSIKEAVRISIPNDRIIVKEGNYYENDIIIEKPLQLLAEGNVIIDGKEKYELILIKSDNVTIDGFTIQNSKKSYVKDYAAIRIEDSKFVEIKNNKILNSFFGIYFSKSENCSVINNFLKSNSITEAHSGNGIHLWYCKDILVSNNHCQGHRDGMYLEFSRNIIVKDNLSENNIRYGLHFMFSDSCKYLNNKFRKNSAGVAVMYSKHIEMIRNRFEFNWGSSSYGLLLKDISQSKIFGNAIYKNSIGIFAEACSDNLIEQNSFIENGWALKLMADCVNNNFEENNFSGNAFDVATNSKQNMNKFDKNYWDNYKGYDLNKDGWGDVPHRPVSLFSNIVVEVQPSIILLRSLFISLLDLAERVFPSITPQNLFDPKPKVLMYDYAF
ncbi:MAG: nitrous oxide reductase family maturation protein NosD [Ignavibacteria bacterium]|nr:nitrous oxide reductase family maturation protein NosD [Ignavibacteria bacterium]